MDTARIWPLGLDEERSSPYSLGRTPLGINWAELDREVDWWRFHRRITAAALRWMIDHDSASWMYMREFPREAVGAGQWETCLRNLRGAPIMPELIAENIIWILRRYEERANLS